MTRERKFPNSSHVTGTSNCATPDGVGGVRFPSQALPPAEMGTAQPKHLMRIGKLRTRLSPWGERHQKGQRFLSQEGFIAAPRAARRAHAILLHRTRSCDTTWPQQWACTQAAYKAAKADQ